MKKLLAFVFLLVSIQFYSQTIIEKENLTVEVTKARKIKATSIQFGNTGYNIISGKDNKRVQLRLQVRSLDKELTPFDPNKLSIVSNLFKSRFSVSEISFATYLRAKGFTMLSDVKPEKGKSIYAGYDPTTKNTFYDDSIENFKDIQLCLNFGTKKKPNVKPVYFKPNTIKKNLLDAYFVLPNELFTAKVFYGDIFIGEINIK